MSTPDGVRDVVVSFAQVRKAVSVAESAATEQAKLPSPDFTPVEQAALLAALGEALRELEKASRDMDADVLVSTQHAAASRLQSLLATGEHACSTYRPLDTTGREVQFDTQDYLRWLWSLKDHVLFSKPHPMVRPTGVLPAMLPDGARIAVLGDWGTGMYGATVSAQAIQDTADPFWMLLHLGDVYYSGTVDEVRDRFLNLWPKRAGAINRALNGNHEMYSGGYGYFNEMLRGFYQGSSYFAYQNANWLLIGLDSAFVDQDLDIDQAIWVNYVAGQAPHDCRIVLFSHHQPFSRLDEQGPLLLARLQLLLESNRIAAWYWGHEHRCIFYNRQPTYGFFGRCIGNGGMPYTRSPVVDFPIKHDPHRENAVWRGFDSRGPAPSGIVLDGPNRYIPGKQEKYGPHGYATLTIKGDTLFERVYAPDGTELHSNTIR